MSNYVLGGAPGGWKPQWERKRREAAAQADTANGATPPIATAGNGPASDPPEHDGSDGDGSAHEDPPPPEIDDPGYAYAQAHAADATLDPVRALVAEFNIKYMVVNEGGKILLYAPMHDPILTRRYHHRMDFADLQRAYMNRSVKVGESFNRPPRSGFVTASAGNTSAASRSPRAATTIPKS